MFFWVKTNHLIGTELHASKLEELFSDVENLLSRGFVDDQ
jgi:hypothetical protein